MLVLVVLIAVVGIALFLKKVESDKVAAMAPEERTRYLEQKRANQQLAAQRAQQARLNSAYGACNGAMVCPHCTTKGQVRVKAVKQKKGISGAKATGALLTGGVSILATGLSRKEKNTQAHCSNCNSTWFF